MRSRDWVFVHVPKTGGTSVRRALQSAFPANAGHFGAAGTKTPHARAWEHIEALGREQWQSLFRFAVVRHPLDRLVSAWAYAFKPEAHRTVEGFRAWVAAGCPLHERYRIRLSGGAAVWMHAPQVDWLTVDGQLEVSALVRLERIAEEWPLVAGAIGAGESLTRENRSDRGAPGDYYDRATRQRALERYAVDFETLGYVP